MRKLWFAGFLLLASSHSGFAQVGGGTAGFRGSANGGTRAVYGEDVNPAQMERRKRAESWAESRDDGTSTFIEASILMNVKADEYIAVFGVLEEGKTPEEANTKMNTTIASFKESLKLLGIKEEDIFVDFVVQNRIYGYRLTETVAQEELLGFELKKNVSIHFTDKLLVDRLAVAAADFRIFDLIKVDYIVKDRTAIQARLQAQTVELIKRKADGYQKLLGVKLRTPSQIVVDKPSVYFPVEQYDSYTAAEAENISVPYDRSRYTVQQARKSRTTYFNPLSGEGFDTVINPIILEPVVQFTTYIKVKYEVPGKSRRRQSRGGFG